MPKSCIVDSGALVALLDPHEAHHDWARATLLRLPEPWFTCEAAVSEMYFLLSRPCARGLDRMLREGHLRIRLDLVNELTRVLDLRAKYAGVPMSLADACLVRMSETIPSAQLVTTDSDFKIYRRFGRQVIPCLMPIS